MKHAVFRLRLSGTLAGLLTLSACTSGHPARESQTLPARAACFLGTEQIIAVSLEWAETSDQRRIGLMGRGQLQERSGMLFNYSSLQSAASRFWMRNTLIALDIAFIDEQHTIVAINQMLPCGSATSASCPTYPAGAEFVQAVEMNAGFFSRYQLALGDQLQTDPALCTAAR